MAPRPALLVQFRERKAWLDPVIRLYHQPVARSSDYSREPSSVPIVLFITNAKLGANASAFIMLG